MSREIAPSAAQAGGPEGLVRDHGRNEGGSPLKAAVEAVGALYAAAAGFTIGAFETWSDRRAERRSLRLGSRAASKQQPRLPRGQERVPQS